MTRLFSKLIFLLYFCLVCSNAGSNRNLETEEEIDDCLEFITDIIPVRLENLKEPIDYSKKVFRLGYYQPKTKYEFTVCKEDDPNDCQLRYSDNETYTVKRADRDYKKVTGRSELHGRSIYRTHSYIFKYDSVKLRLTEGLSEDGNSCIEGYRICGKFTKLKIKILCFPEDYDCPFKEIKGSAVPLSTPFTDRIQLEDNIYWNYYRYTENDYITSLFSGFMYIPMSDRENIEKLPFSFTNSSSSKYNLVFGPSGQIDMRELFKENNIYSHFLDFYLKGITINSNFSYYLSLNTKFVLIENLERKCNVKEEPREEYVFDDYDGDCLSMIEHIYPIRPNRTEKIYEKDVFELAYYQPKTQYEHILCKTSNKNDCKFKYNNDSVYQKIYDDKEYDVMNTTYIWDTAKPVYLFQQRAYKFEKINIHFKESFDINLYKCKDGYRACARIKHHPWATLLCVPNDHYCPFSDIIGDMYLPDEYYQTLYPYEFGYYVSNTTYRINFHYGRYKMNETVNYITNGIFLRDGINDEKFNELFPFSLSEYKRGIGNIISQHNYVYNMEKIFTENGIPVNFVKYHYPDENQDRQPDDRQTRMYLAADRRYFKDLELKCDVPSSSDKEVILYAIWGKNDAGNNQNDKGNDTAKNETEQIAKESDTIKNEPEKTDKESSNNLPIVIPDKESDTTKHEEEKTDKPIEEKSDKPIEEKTDKPLEEKTDKPLTEKSDKPIEEKTDKPLTEKSDKPLTEKSDKPLTEKSDKPIEEKSDKPLTEKSDKPLEEKTDKEKPDKESDTKPEEEKTDKGAPGKDENKETDGKGSNDGDTIIKEKAKQKSKVSLSFRQLSGFKYSSKTVSFLLYALATEEMQKGETINLAINLIKSTGETEENSRNVSCTLQKDVKPVDNNSMQAVFNCQYSGLTDQYISLRLNNSENIVGIPTNDETSLNPILTDKSIEKGEKLNYTDEKNIDTIPASYIPESIDQNQCKTKGVFTIKGKLTKEVTLANKFNIPLAYPAGITITCGLTGTNLECSVDREINDTIILEQIIIKDEANELLNIKGFTSPEVLNCQNGVLNEAEAKSELSIAFRQVSHLVDNKNNGFSFYFAGFTGKSLTKGENIVMKMILLLNGVKTEKEAKCVLQNDVTVGSSGLAQGDFNCEVTLEDSEYKNLNISNPYAITISPDNVAISGCSGLNKEESSPKATDNAIEETKNESSELAKTLDYSLDENKNNVPSILKINNITDLNKCDSKGKFKLKGVLSSDIDDKMTFDLPLAFPKTNIKCEIEEAKKDQEIDIYCKVQKGFTNVNTFIIESRLLKKKSKELLFITNKKIEFTQEYDCDNFNTIKFQKAKTQKSLPYSFLQMSRPQNMDPSMLFFMTLMKKASQTSFADIILNIDVIIQKSSTLRLLQQTSDIENLEVNCKVKESSTTSGSYGCSSTQSLGGNITKVEINDNSIGEVPELITVETNPSIDYTLKTNLEKLDSLPSINITDFDGDECDTSGQWTITGDITGTLSSADNITIQLSNPDSSGLCKLTVNNNKATIVCENAEEFSTSTIMISPQIVNDKYGTTSLFKISNTYTSPYQYSCIISNDWSIPHLESITNSTPSVPSTTSTTNYPNTTIPETDIGQGLTFRKKDSSGLSGGAIAGIVIASVVVVVAVVVLIILGKKGVLFKNKNNVMSGESNNSTTIRNIV